MEDVDNLDRLTDLVRWTGVGVDDIDWAEVSETVGLNVPSAFRKYVNRFPAGVYQTFLEVEQPRSGDEVAGYAGRVEEQLMVLRVATELSRGRSYDVFPKVPGLFPWGNIGTEYLFCWKLLQPQIDPSEIVIIDTADNTSNTIAGTMVECIVDVIQGRVDKLQFVAESCIPPRFDPLWLDAAASPTRDVYLTVNPDQRLAVSPEGADEVEELLFLVAVTPLPETVDWPKHEVSLSHRLPRDYKGFVETLGPGRYGDIFVASPYGPISEFPGIRSAKGERYPHHPGMSGLTYNASIQIARSVPDPSLHPVVWGEAFGWYLGWMPGDYPTDLRPVLVFRPGHRGQVYQQSMTSYLATHLRDPVAWRQSLWRIGES